MRIEKHHSMGMSEEDVVRTLAWQRYEFERTHPHSAVLLDPVVAKLLDRKTRLRQESNR